MPSGAPNSFTELAKALQALSCKATTPPTSLYLSLLRSCIHIKQQALPFARQLQAHIAQHHIPLTGLLGDYLVLTLAKCGSLHDALLVSAQLPCLTVFSGTALISAYTDSGSPHEALSLYQSLQEQGIHPSIYTVVSLFKACGNIPHLHYGMVFHADAITYGFLPDAYAGNTLISMYGKCGAIVEAEHVFYTSSHRDVVSWNAMLSAYVEHEDAQKALKLYVRMQDENIRPDRPTYVAILQACATLAKDVEASFVNGELIKVMPIDIGHALHLDINTKGFACNIYVSSGLIRMYGKCGALKEAENVFSALLCHDVVSCGAMISVYVDQGNGEKALRLYRQMHEEGISPDMLTEILALQACGTLLQLQDSFILERQLMFLEIGQALQVEARKKGFESDAFFSKTLLSLYGKCGAILEAFYAFSMSSQHDVSTWNALLCANVEHGKGNVALQLYIQMQEEGVSPDPQTYVILLQACALLAEMEEGLLEDGRCTKVESLNIGKALHADASAWGFTSDVYVCNAILNMFVKCEALLEAEDMFCALVHRNVVSWSTMLTGYVEQGQGATALRLYRQMQEEAASCSDELTFVIALQACMCFAERKSIPLMEMHSHVTIGLEVGRALHVDAFRKGFLSSALVISNFVSMYSKCGTIAEAESLFGAMLRCADMSWSVVLSAYLEHGEAEKLLLWYRKMHEEGQSANQITCGIALQACAILAELEVDIVDGFQGRVMAMEIGRALHADAYRLGFVSDIFVCSTLVSIYGKWGAVKEAEDVFEGSPQKTVVLCNAMLSGYVGQGLQERGLSLYQQMIEQDMTLDEVTLINILKGSGATGNLDMCKQSHFDLVCAGFEQVPCMVSSLLHAYGSCASMDDAQDFFGKISKPDIISWNACIAGYVGEGNVIASLCLFEELIYVFNKPSKVSFLMILSACGHAGLLVQGLEYFISLSKYSDFNPDSKHYGSLLDLLGRAGDFRRLENLLERMPVHANLTIWSCLLGACRMHANLDLALQVFHRTVHFDYEEAISYGLISNMWAGAGLQERAMEELSA